LTYDRRRRALLKGLSLIPLVGCLPQEASPNPVPDSSPHPDLQLRRKIPSTGEPIPCLGLGTYRAFSRLDSEETTSALREVLTLFSKWGGRVIDTSPMYANAESVLGTLLPQAPSPESGWFLATKVWTNGQSAGESQMKSSSERIGASPLDLVQIHNLRDWKTHLPTLRRLKGEGKIRYIGLTTWGGHDHARMLEAMKSKDIDFIQVSYNIFNRKIEDQILPVAQELGLAVLANRPFEQGRLFSKVEGRDIPEWARSELKISSWAQFFLKFLLADERVTAVIPATSKPRHLVDNMRAGLGPLPDAELRTRMVSYLEQI